MTRTYVSSDEIRILSEEFQFFTLFYFANNQIVVIFALSIVTAVTITAVTIKMEL